MTWEDQALASLDRDPAWATEHDLQVMIAAYLRARSSWRGSGWSGAPNDVLDRMRAWITAAHVAVVRSPGELVN